jgi:hypothetical protein
MRTRQFVSGILIVGFSLSTALAIQDKSSAISAIESKLIQLAEQEYPNWKHESVTPLEGASEVIIDKWTSDDADVSVKIIRYSSDDNAQKHIQQFVKDMKAAYISQEDSDEAYSMSSRGNSIAARKRHFLIYITVNAKTPDDESKLLKQTNKLASKALKE